MSKTIDVRPGDTWTIDDTGRLWQYRSSRCRLIDESGLWSWESAVRLPFEETIISKAATTLLRSWGYTITDPDEKPTENHAPAVKPDSTTDVVDAVWVRTRWNDGKCYLTPHADVNRATEYMAIANDARSDASIVRLRSVDELARFAANHANERLDRHANRLAEAHDRIDALESRLDTLATQVAARDARLVERLEKVEKPADKPAARVVLPGMSSHYSAMYRFGWASAINEVKAALASQGITIADEGSKT